VAFDKNRNKDLIGVGTRKNGRGIRNKEYSTPLLRNLAIM
jgi:hypothetical protein